MANMLEFAKSYPIVETALPMEQREILKLPRDYIASLCYTLVGRPFVDWVDAQVQTRNRRIQD